MPSRYLAEASTAVFYSRNKNQMQNYSGGNNRKPENENNFVAAQKKLRKFVKKL